MTNCQNQACLSERIVSINGKTADRCFVGMGDNVTDPQHDGYVPIDIGMGDNEDYLDFSYCLDCGQIQGTFPLPITNLERFEQY